MRTDLAVVTDTKNPIPIYLDRKESVFCYYDTKARKFKPADEARIVEDDNWSSPIFASMRNQLQEFLHTILIERNLPTDISYDFSQVKQSTTFRPRMYRAYGERPSTYQSNTKADVQITDFTQEQIGLAFDCVNNYLGLYNPIKVRGQYLKAHIVINIIGPDKVITVDSLRDGHDKDTANPRLWLGESISWIHKEKKFFGIIKKFSPDNFEVITTQGERKTLYYGHESIEKAAIPSENIVENQLSETVIRNFAESMDKLRLYRSKVKIMKVEEQFLMGGKVLEAKCANCPNCGIVMREKNNCEFSCVMCSQAAKMIHQEGDVGLFVLGEKPVKYNFCSQEAKCCGNCNLSTFETNSAGFKRMVGNCEFTSQVIQAHNTCPHWVPLVPKDFHSNLKRNATNFNAILKNNTNKQRGTDTMAYDRNDYSTRSKQMTEVAASYELAYLEWTKKVIEVAKSLPIAEL